MHIPFFFFVSCTGMCAVAMPVQHCVNTRARAPSIRSFILDWACLLLTLVLLINCSGLQISRIWSFTGITFNRTHMHTGHNQMPGIILVWLEFNRVYLPWAVCFLNSQCLVAVFPPFSLSSMCQLTPHSWLYVWRGIVMRLSACALDLAFLAWYRQKFGSVCIHEAE